MFYIRKSVKHIPVYVTRFTRYPTPKFRYNLLNCYPVIPPTQIISL